MERVNLAIGVVLGMLAVLGSIAAMLRWFMARLFRMLDERIDARLGQTLDAIDRRFDAVDRRFDAVDQRFDAVDRRFDRLEGNVDHLADKTDVRLSHLEADMTLVKQHLLGSAA